MKACVTSLLVIALLAAGMVYLYPPERLTKTDLVEAHNVSTDDMAKDMDGFVVGVPTNQFWLFSSDQKIHLTVVQKKQKDDIVSVAVRVVALANVPPAPPGEKKDEKAPPAPSKVMLSGLAKLHYERLGGQWYLRTIENVSMRVSAVEKP